MTSCSSWNFQNWPWNSPESSSGTEIIEWEDVPSKPFPILKAVGYAPLDGQPGQTRGQQVLMAMRASKIDAYRNLLEQVYGQEIETGTTVKNWIGQNDYVKVKVSGVISGAKILKSYQVGDHYVVEMELDFARVWNLYKQRNPQRKVKGVRYF
tara:strand:- start:3178 stop:3636 length:459 start_codon:yes stop_codon:yes gene_type:complete